MVKIGNIELSEFPLLLAPMEDVSDPPFRAVCKMNGADLMYTELEWRFPLQKESDKLGGVVFLNMTTASSRQDNVGLYNYVKLGYGAGLRYMLDTKKRVNLGLDYGFGFNGAQSIFLNLNEYF